MAKTATIKCSLPADEAGHAVDVAVTLTLSDAPNAQGHYVVTGAAGSCLLASTQSPGSDLEPTSASPADRAGDPAGMSRTPALSANVDQGRLAWGVVEGS